VGNCDYDHECAMINLLDGDSTANGGDGSMMVPLLTSLSNNSMIYKILPHIVTSPGVNTPCRLTGVW
jgi:hypothetical protein